MRRNLRTPICIRRLFIILGSSSEILEIESEVWIFSRSFMALTSRMEILRNTSRYLSSECVMLVFLVLKIPLNAFYGIYNVCSRLYG